jgi:phosphate starvation-inducible PhoH-like protein
MILSETDSKTLNGHIEEALLIPFKGEKRKSKKEKRHEALNENKFHLRLKHVEPLTENQKIVFNSWRDGYHLFLHGLAGTGKSYISLYLALKEMQDVGAQYKNILIVRSAVPSRDIGFLPGSIKEKTRVYEQPYQIICNELYGRGDAYDILKNKRIIDFTTTSFIRGNTLYDTIVIVDEIQNMIGSELDTVITRLGENCRIVFCGDYRQTDLLKKDERRGVHDFMRVIKSLNDFSFVEFEEEDIMRSALVKNYIINKNRMGVTFV